MYVSFLRPNSIAPDSDYVQKCGKEKNGTILQKVLLKDILNACKQCPIARQKHENGAIFPYISQTLGKTNWKDQLGTNDGVIFIDIDNITKQAATEIYDNFERLGLYFPALYAIQYSSSHYISNKKSGLHIYVASDTLNSIDYKYYATLSLMIFARAVEKCLNIDLRKCMIDQEVILDDHNTEMTQRFFLFHSDYKINEDCIIINDSIIPKEHLTKLIEHYPRLRLVKSIYVNKKIDLEMTATNNNIKKICVDRNFTIGKYSGNDIRWRISRIAQNLFGDDAQQWCDRYFYFKDNNNRNRSIYSKQSNVENISIIIKEWLEDNHYLQSSQSNVIRKNEYIIKYKDKILDFINKHDRTEVVAPTGTGKTTFINGEKDSKYDLFNQNISAQFSLARHLNAIVIVPFNVTNKLYDNLIEINSDNNNKVDDNNACVMVWDQAIKHWNKIKDRTLIIDEAHCLYLDRTYRDKAVQLMKKIKEDNCKIILFTATPADEAKELDCQIMKFNNERDYIKTDFIKVNNIDISQYNYIVKCLENNWYDKIVLFDDTSAKKIYEKLYCSGKFIDDVAYIRADTKNSDDFKYLRQYEQLNKKLTICTCVAFNGLNFKNENENVLVITSLSKNTTSGEIIQEAGRIRKSNVFLKVFYNDIEKVDNLEENIRRAEILNNAEKVLDIPQGLIRYDEHLVNEDIKQSLRSIQKYVNEHSLIDVIFEDLLKTGYFVIKTNDWTDDSKKYGNMMRLELKRKESNEFLIDLKNNDMLEKTYDSDYKIEWQNQIKKMINNDTYIGVTLDTFIDMYDNKKKNTLISSIIEKMKQIIYISLLDESSWSKYEKNISNVQTMLGDDQVAIKKLYSNYKENKKIRNKYKDKIIYKEKNIIDLSNVFVDVIAELARLYDEEKEKVRTSRQKRIIITDKFKFRQKYNLEIGQTFDSCIELARHINKNKDTVSKWMKKEWIKEL